MLFDEEHLVYQNLKYQQDLIPLSTCWSVQAVEANLHGDSWSEDSWTHS